MTKLELLIIIILVFTLGFYGGWEMRNKRFSEAITWLQRQDLNRCYAARTDMLEAFYPKTCLDDALEDFIKSYYD